jgi:glucuronoarabinoxylan endo-1,4-beta-xylanase
MRINLLRKRLPYVVILIVASAMVCCFKKDARTGEQDVPSTMSTIDMAVPRQTIRGFGGTNYLPWRPDMTTDEIKKAFGTDSGQIGLSILRLRVPSQESEFQRNVATAKTASAMGASIIASPWTPPARMKTNSNLVGGRLSDTCYGSYAAYLKSFVEFMASSGAPIYALSIQNEPDISVLYESCSWNASQMLAFVKNNAPVVGTRIIIPESFNFDRTLSDPILNDSVAASHVSIIGGHIYGGGFTGFLWSLYQSVVGGGHVGGGGLTAYSLAISRGKELWMTEHLVTDTSWSAVLGTAKEIHDCLNDGMSAYLWWYIVRFYGPILEDGSVSKRGYVMSQYARFIRPGYLKVDATANPQSGVYVTACKIGPKLTIVVINTGSSSVEQAFAIKNGTVVSLTPYVTSNTENCARGNAIAASNGSFTATLRPSSVTTYVSN